MRILIKYSEIAKRLESLSDEIGKWIVESSKPVKALWIAEGAMFFAADLLRKIRRENIEIHSLKVTSYGNATTPQSAPKILSNIPDVAGARILLIDDILDTGNTAAAVKSVLLSSGADEVKLCVLLDKKIDAPKAEKADFVGFPVEGAFVFGYGLDYNGHHRNAADICAVDNAYKTQKGK